MAKLYWRVKVNGKWTWKPANSEVIDVDYENEQMYVLIHLEEEVIWLSSVQHSWEEEE
jgi:hypothetical protein